MKHPKRLASKISYENGAVVKPLTRRQMEAQAAAEVYDEASGLATITAAATAALPAPVRVPYAELHCLSHFSFGRGASSARELFERARRNGYSALAITDECTLAGIVRAHVAASPKHPKTLHYTGDGVFMVSGKIISRRSQFQPGRL